MRRRPRRSAGHKRRLLPSNAHPGRRSALMQEKTRGFSFPFFPSRKYLVLLLIACPIIAVSALPAAAKERRAEVTYSVDLKASADAKHVRLWLPYPMSDENQEITDVVVTGNPTSSGVYKEGAFGKRRAPWPHPDRGRRGSRGRCRRSCTGCGPAARPAPSGSGSSRQPRGSGRR